MVLHVLETDHGAESNEALDLVRNLVLCFRQMGQQLCRSLRVADENQVLRICLFQNSIYECRCVVPRQLIETVVPVPLPVLLVVRVLGASVVPHPDVEPQIR